MDAGAFADVGPEDDTRWLREAAAGVEEELQRRQAELEEHRRSAGGSRAKPTGAAAAAASAFDAASLADRFKVRLGACTRCVWGRNADRRLHSGSGADDTQHRCSPGQEG
jgi:hypothetical protein